LKKIFDLDEFGNLKMCFKAKLELNLSQPLKVSGALGHLTGLEMNSPTVSEIKIGESGTKVWNLGGMNSDSTYTFILDSNNTTNTIPKSTFIQVITTYVAGDRTQRLRVTTVEKKVLPELTQQHHFDEIGTSFDQEAAAVLIARLGVFKGFTEESREILKWIDKILIRLMSKFSKYTPNAPSTFKLTEQFTYFPQFMFYLRRSCFVQNFNASPDEITYFKSTLMRENVMNCTIMIQPILFAYSPESPNANPVFLDIGSMKNDNVLLLDAFFFIVIWHGDEVCKWREAGYHLDPDYENIKQMMENPTDYAQSLLTERLPISRFVSCDSGSGQERLLKSTVNPSPDTRNKVVEDGFCSDDVSLKVFMDFLKKLAVSS
jgi:protein transport protein SEC23